MPAWLKIMTIMPATETPDAIAKAATLKGIPKITAAIAPLQAPVSGKGIAIKINRAQNEYL